MWADLGSDDPVLVERAMTGFLANPQQANAFLTNKLKPALGADPRRFKELLVALDSNRFPMREAASRELKSLGEGIEADLKKVLHQRLTAEARRRIEDVLEAIKRERLFPQADRLRAIRAVEILEHIGSDAAWRTLGVLAGGASGASLTIEASTALERLKASTRRNDH